MIFDIPQDLIDDLVNCPGDESNHLHIGYWILQENSSSNQITGSINSSLAEYNEQVNFPSDKETPRYSKLETIKRKRNGKTINK